MYHQFAQKAKRSQFRKHLTRAGCHKLCHESSRASALSDRTKIGHKKRSWAKGVTWEMTSAFLLFWLRAAESLIPLPQPKRRRYCWILAGKNILRKLQISSVAVEEMCSFLPAEHCWGRMRWEPCLDQFLMSCSLMLQKTEANTYFNTVFGVTET